MIEYYEPTCLFRQNAIRRVSSSDEETSSDSSWERQMFSYIANNNRSPSGLLQQSLAQDTMVMNKACALDRDNIKSNYWKIPDTEMNLTALAVNDVEADSPLLAISSTNLKNNLFIHELDSVNNYLIHHTTISLPHIHGLSWVHNTSSRFLISGNNKGYAHLVSVPRPLHCEGQDESDECAEIIKRFNHRKHLKLVSKETSTFSHASTCISELGFLSERLVTCYDDTLFVWNMNGVELAMRPRPEFILVVSGIRSFDPSVTSKTTLALCGAFGVSLFDTRTTQHNDANTYLLLKDSLKRIMTNKVKWHPTNEHLLGSSHQDGIVRLWDIRKNDTFAELAGHSGKTVTSMSWNGNDLFTGASDGNIIHWDLTSNLDPETELSQHGDKILRCSLREGFDSVAFDTVSNSIVEKVNERQCGTSLPALNNTIISMCPIVGSGPRGSCSVLLIDGAAFLGLHCKIYDAANTSAVSLEKHFYSQEDISMIRQEGSGKMLVGLSESLIRPLSILKKTHSFLSEETLEGATTEQNGKSNLSLFDETATLSDVVSAVEIEDFDFIQHDAFDKWKQSLHVVSLHSVTSLPEAENSPYSSGMLDNNSTASLSTVATLIGPVDQETHKESLVNFLDLELERICGAFRGHS